MHPSNTFNTVKVSDVVLQKNCVAINLQLNKNGLCEWVLCFLELAGMLR